MEYINLHVSVLDSEEFKGATPTQRATWLCLLRYLVGQEDGDTIEKCRGWCDRKWQQICAVTEVEINDVCGLWNFDGDDLTVNFYPHSAEKQTRAMRKGGKIGNQRRWGKDSKKHPDKPPDTIPDSPPDSPPVSITKRNETKDNGREGPPIEIPSEETIREFCSSYRNLAVGIEAGISEVWWTGWMAARLERNQWPARWQAALTMAHRSDWMNPRSPGHAKAHGENSAKLAFGVENEKNGKTAAQTRYLLDRELTEVTEALEAYRQSGAEPDAETVQREKNLRGQLSKIG